jgi:putative GTP pyrophosphokinase
MTNKKYHELITPYQDAMSIMVERINLLDRYLYEESDIEQKAIHHIESRIKSQESIEEKLKKLNLPVNKENAMENLKDIAVPLYYMDASEYFPVEIQFRSMAMDLWASMEHRICYKKDKDGVLKKEFIRYAEELEQLEKNFQENLSRMTQKQVAT